MALHRDLLEQARYLAKKEPRKPKQASLRRAVSTAYYALFHLLLDEASHLLICGAEPEGLRDLVKRAFQHNAMQDASKAFSQNLPAHVQRLIGPMAPPSLRIVAEVFVDLQEARHQADYNLSRHFSRSEALQLVQRVENAFALWAALRKQPETKVYLTGLLLWPRWKR